MSPEPQQQDEVRPEAADGSPAGPSAEDADRGDAEHEAEVIESDFERIEREATEYRDHLMRLQAEFDNYRKRVAKEQSFMAERAVEPLVAELLGVADDFELALMSATSQPDFDAFLRGVELVYAKFLDSLRAAGVERIEADGKPFDPEQHEALMQEGDGEEMVVADVLRPGYTMRGRVVRPAGVKVRRS